MVQHDSSIRSDPWTGAKMKSARVTMLGFVFAVLLEPPGLVSFGQTDSEAEFARDCELTNYSGTKFKIGIRRTLDPIARRLLGVGLEQIRAAQGT
jgi:hypothetical protein